jgi:SagB-type dehydrogenase family enzyme
MDALAYHELTKHSPESVRRAGGLDFSNQPRLFKKYVGLGATAIPASLADVIRLSGGITKWLGGMPFRANACTGALYHIEIYVVGGELDGLAAGVYHVDIQADALVPLRSGDYRAALAAAAGHPASLGHAPVALVFTTTYWRNAWKYRTRMYRHAFWDLGTMLSNTLAVAGAQGAEPEVLTAFADDEVNRLLAVDPGREVALAIVPLGCTAEPPPPSPPVEPLALEIEPYSPREIDYPEIGAAHRASCLASGDEAAAWRMRALGLPHAAAPEPQGTALSLPSPSELDLSAPALAGVIRRRGSTRQFAPVPITLSELSSIFDLALASIPADFTPMVELYLIVHAVEGLDAGAYAVDRDRRTLILLRRGVFRHQAGFLALGQALAADAALNLYSLVNLPPVIARLGNRGYRTAQLEGGIIGGRVYLGAYALGLGATGLTFFDDQVTEFFSPHAVAKSVMFLSAVGHRPGSLACRPDLGDSSP